MLDIKDFDAKQIIIALCSYGEKIQIQNDNIVIRDSEGKIKCQATCYRLFSIFVIGQTSITTALIDRSKKFGFSIVFFTMSFKVYEVIGFKRDSNTLLRMKQYSYDSLNIAKHIIINKIDNQKNLISLFRNKSEEEKDAISTLEQYKEGIEFSKNINELMAYEGLASKAFFMNYFRNIGWDSRRPRIKSDYINSSLDIGYTVLFAYVEAILNIYGFDLYKGVLHTLFYMRKSLVCDIIEPFRCIVDKQTLKSINLGQIKESDFIINNHRYELEWKSSAKYVSIYLQAILEHKHSIFLYIRQYYRSFIRSLDEDKYPNFKIKDE